MTTEQLSTNPQLQEENLCDVIFASINEYTSRAGRIIDDSMISEQMSRMDDINRLISNIKYEQERARDIFFLGELLIVKTNKSLYGGRDVAKNKNRLQEALSIAGVDRVQRLLGIRG